LPFKGNKFIGGWQLSGITTRQSGLPFSATTAFLPGDGVTQQAPLFRPNLVPGKSNNPILGGPNVYFHRGAFSNPVLGFYGNLGRNTLTGPGLVNVDFALSKNTAITEKANVQFRAEFFDILNHPNFNNPTGQLFDSRGNPTPVQSSTQINSTVGNSGRVVQFGLKLIF